jgi:purine catabolism regulator
MITVRDLLDAPELRFSLAAGSDEALDRVVVAAHVSELTNPSPWLQGGELLMTAGLMLEKALDGYREYLQDCRRGGVSGVVLGLGADLPFQRAPADLVLAAEEVGLPLLVLPDPIPFIAVTKWVFARIAAEERQEWQDAVAITRELTRAAATATPLESLLTTWSTALGTSVLVTDLNGVPLSSYGDGVDDLVAQSHDLVQRTVGEGVRSLSTSSLDGEHGVEVLTLGSSHPRGLAILERSGDARARHAVNVFVSLLSLEVDHRHASDNPERLRRAQVVAKLLRPGLRPDQGPRLAASIGLEAAALRVVVVRTREGEQAEELAATLTAALSASAARPRISAVELLVPDADGLVATFDRLAGGRAVGIGGVGRAGDLAVSARQAHSLVELSAHLGRPVQVEEGGTARLLLQLGPPAVLAAFSDAVLAPIDELETRERVELLHTLEEWLRVNGAWEAAAQRLSLHRNTVRNRIARLSALTGRPLESAEHRLELWLALQARAAAVHVQATSDAVAESR